MPPWIVVLKPCHDMIISYAEGNQKLLPVVFRIYTISLCDGTINFYRDQDRDQGRDHKYDGTGTKAGNRNMTGPEPGPRTGTRFGLGPGP